MAKKPVPTPPQKPTAPVITPDAVEDLPRIINVVHIKSGKPMEVSKDYYLRHQEKFVRE